MSGTKSYQFLPIKYKDMNLLLREYFENLGTSQSSRRDRISMIKASYRLSFMLSIECSLSSSAGIQGNLFFKIALWN